MKARAALAPLVPYLATFAWAFLAFVAGQFAALAAFILWQHSGLRPLPANPYDGAVVTLSILLLNPVTVGMLLLAVRLRHADPREYLALTWPPVRLATVGIIGIFIVIAVTDALLFVSGHAIVSPFQLVSYTTAAREGWLPLMWPAIVIVGPAGEEIMFRGFLFRGWVSSRRSGWIAVPLISLLWTGLHVQYDWVYMPEIFVAGLLLGWVRFSSGSTLLTFLLHALLNLEGMLETVAQVRHVF
jgi:uncharacterized protein